MGRTAATTTARRALLGAALVAAGAAGCGDDDPSTPPPGVAVVISYEAPTALDPATAQASPDCVQAVARTHVHASWRGFAALDMTAEGAARWTATFEDVPAGTRVRIRVNDPNRCDDHPTGAVTAGVLASGVRLTEIVDTPGSGVEPGFAFTVAANGTVTP